MYKNGPPSSLMRASCTDYYELITDNFITSGISTYCVIIVQPLGAPKAGVAGVLKVCGRM